MKTMQVIRNIKRTYIFLAIKKICSIVTWGTRKILSMTIIMIALAPFMTALIKNDATYASDGYNSIAVAFYEAAEKVANNTYFQEGVDYIVSLLYEKEAFKAPLDAIAEKCNYEIKEGIFPF